PVLCSLLMRLRPSRSTLFPYTTLFRSAIQAVHSDAPTAVATDWRQVLALYDQLLVMTPTPVVAMNRAVALAEVAGSAAALDALRSEEHTSELQSRENLVCRLLLEKKNN